MPAKIRLARHGRKKFAFYHIVIADGRAPRDGRFIEKIGIYNPNTNPATIDLDFDKALDWLNKGAQPTETVRAILSYKGVMYKKHLLEGVKKGAFSEEDAEKKFTAWLSDKEAKIQTKKDWISKETDDDLQKRLEAEMKIKEDRAAEIAKKASDLAAAIEKDKQEEQAGDADADVKDSAADASADADTEEKLEAKEEKTEAKDKSKDVPKAKAEVKEEKKEEDAEPKDETPEVKEEKPEAKEDKSEAKEEKTEEKEEKTEAKDEKPEAKEEKPEVKEEKVEAKGEKPEAKEEKTEAKEEKKEDK